MSIKIILVVNLQRKLRKRKEGNTFEMMEQVMGYHMCVYIQIYAHTLIKYIDIHQCFPLVIQCL